MIKFFKRIWTILVGTFFRMGDDAVSSSPSAIRSTYAVAIDDAYKRYRDMQQAVALLAREREKTSLEIKKLSEREEELQRKLNGALSLSEQDPDNEDHRKAGARYLEEIQKINSRQAELEKIHENQIGRVDSYKGKLRDFTSEIEKLKREQGEMVAEFVSNKHIIELESKLQGIGETSTDSAIVAIREKVANLRAEANIASEMGEATAETTDKQYEEAGAETQAVKQFDELLKARSYANKSTSSESRELG
jgi:phage shock protein A